MSKANMTLSREQTVTTKQTVEVSKWSTNKPVQLVPEKGRKTPRRGGSPTMATMRPESAEKPPPRIVSAEKHTSASAENDRKGSCSKEDRSPSPHSRQRTRKSRKIVAHSGESVRKMAKKSRSAENYDVRMPKMSKKVTREDYRKIKESAEVENTKTVQVKNSRESKETTMSNEANSDREA